MNIKYFLISVLAVGILAGCAAKEEVLFNGENLDGWKTVVKDDTDAYSGASTFSAEEGVMHISGQPFGYIRTEKKYTDFKKRVQSFNSASPA